jgi:hypothetical protein
MWNWLNCYLSGRHDFGVTCSIFLRCIHCGKRSNGWDVHNEPQPALIPVTSARRPVARTPRPMPFLSRDIAPDRRSA